MGTAVFGAPEFKARSGRTVRPMEDGSIGFHLGNGYLTSLVAMDAEEFFQAKHDWDLGRWRWSENSHIVIYLSSNSDIVRVLDEREATVHTVHRSDAACDIEHAAWNAGRAYFDAHPESKSWHGARPHEGWVLTIDGVAQIATVDSSLDFSTSTETFVNGSPDMARITAGRRIWPEDAA